MRNGQNSLRDNINLPQARGLLKKLEEVQPTFSWTAQNQANLKRIQASQE